MPTYTEQSNLATAIMRSAAFALILLASFVSAHAGEAVGIVCDHRSDKLVVRYYDSPSTRTPARNEQRWNLFDLLTLSADGTEWTKAKQIRTTCALKAVTFDVTIEPYPGNGFANGRCGGAAGAELTVRRNGQLVLSKYAFDEGMCSSESTPFTSEVSFASGDRKATIVRTER